MKTNDIKRVCLFAGYSKEKVIEEYVVYLISKLSTISDVYYLSDNNLSEEEKNKIKPYTHGVYGFSHGKYDFGSWQELIYILGWEKLAEYDELILINDSVIGPIFNINILIEKTILDSQWQVCGINSAYDYKTWHLSSYFLMIKKEVFLSKPFKDYIHGIEKEERVEKVIEKYEIGLSKMLHKEGYLVKSLVDFRKNIYISWRTFIKKGSPFLKKKIFSTELYILSKSLSWNIFMKKNTNFDRGIIKRYIDKEYKKIGFIRFIFNKNLWKYALKGAIKIEYKEDREIIRVFGIYIRNKIDYSGNKIGILGR